MLTNYVAFYLECSFSVEFARRAAPRRRRQDEGAVRRAAGLRPGGERSGRSLELVGVFVAQGTRAQPCGG